MNAWEFEINIPYEEVEDGYIIRIAKDDWESFKRTVELGVISRGTSVEVVWKGFETKHFCREHAEEARRNELEKSS